MVYHRGSSHTQHNYELGNRICGCLFVMFVVL
nr:MAG TPA: hypothetical protein [Caudoviricetes sp.]